MTTTQQICDEVYTERMRQDRKWGPQQHSMTEWISILTEEIGEAAMKANHFHFPGPRQSGHDEQAMLRHELVQSAAVCVAIVEQLDNGQALVTTDNPMAEQKMNI